MSEHRHAPHTSKADAVLANLDDLVRSGRNGRGGEPLHDDLKAVLALVASVVRTEYAALAATPAASDGRAVHAAWRDGMLRQGREVAPERMTWDTLSEQDRELDDWIASRLRTPAASDGSLDVAWTAAEAAMPDGWRIRSLILMGRRWEAVAAEGGRGSGREIYIAHGPTPTAALRALAARLSESPSEGKTE